MAAPIDNMIREEYLSIRNSYRPKYFIKENVVRQEIKSQILMEAFADFDKMAQSGEMSNIKADMTVSDIVPKIEDLYNHIIIFFDTETTGFTPKYNQLTEIGAICVKPDLGGKSTITDEFNVMVHLNNKTLSRIDREDLQKKQGTFKYGKTTGDILDMTSYWSNLDNVRSADENVALQEFLDFIEEMSAKHNRPLLLVAHNAPFDMKFINTRCSMMRVPLISKEHKVLDSLDFIYDYYYPLMISAGDIESDPTNAALLTKDKRTGNMTKTKYGTPKLSFRLGNLSTKFNINADNWHTAIADVQMLMGWMDKMVRQVMTTSTYEPELPLRTPYEQSQGVIPNYDKKSKNPQAAQTRRTNAQATALAKVMDKPGRNFGMTQGSEQATSDEKELKKRGVSQKGSKRG